MERGRILRLTTLDLPASDSVHGLWAEIREAANKDVVAIAVSFSHAIAWCFAESSALADAEFTAKRYMTYRGTDNQYEIPCVNEDKFLYIRAFTQTPLVTNGLSWYPVSGSEAT